MGLRRLCAVRAAVLVAAACLAGMSPAAADPKVERELSRTAHGFGRIAEPARAGAYAHYFELRHGDCGRAPGWSDCATNRSRTEVSRPDIRFAPGSVAWIGYSIFVPRSFRPSDPVVSTAGQITSRGVELRKFLPVVYMNLDRHGYTACIVRSQPTRQESEDCIHAHVASLDRMKGRWTDIQIGFDTRVPGGRIEIWANDRLVERAEGFHRRRAPQYHFKYGIYRLNISRYPGALPTQVLLFDEVRFGQSRAAVRVDEATPVN